MQKEKEGVNMPEFSKYKKSLPMHKYGWLRKWDEGFITIDARVI
jgi:hypothetical protein